MNAHDILNLLSEKHARDIFVSNCKTGTSYDRGLLILDAWVMKPSYAHPLAIGYEIKINRGDFLGDTKWRNYLDYCNEFYFVCPKGLIAPTELPAEVGLLWMTTNSMRLHTKKKSIYRDIVIPNDIFRYILMSRAIIKDHIHRIDKIDKTQYWKAWLSEKDERLVIGGLVREKIRNIYSDLMFKNNQLAAENKSYDEIKRWLAEINVCIDGYNAHYTKKKIQNRLEEIRRGFSDEFIDNLKKIQDEIREVLENLNHSHIGSDGVEEV